MRNIGRLFVSDMERLFGSVVTVIIALGLVLLPSIFTWYNVLACWDVFGNTGNLTVAVADLDEGYQSDLIPVRLNLGDQVTSALRANDQLDWVFTDEEDAIEGTREGRYYAAVVIPSTFSRDMMSFYSDNVEHARITYYSNQKRSAIAPKVTDQGADQISRQVNQVFAETLSEIALGLSSSLLEYADDTDINSAAGKLATHISKVSDDMTEAADTLMLYSNVFDTSIALIEDSNKLLANARQSADQMSSTTEDARSSSDSLAAALDDSVSALSSAIQTSASSYDAVPSAVDAAFDSANTLGGDISSRLRSNAEDIDAIASDYRKLVDQLEDAKPYLPDDVQGTATSLISRLNNSINLQEQLRDALLESANDIEDTSADVQAHRETVDNLAAATANSLAEARTDYDDNLRPALSDLGSTLAAASSSISTTVENVKTASDKLEKATPSLAKQLRTSQEQLAATSDNLRKAAQDIESLGNTITKAITSGDVEALRSIIGSNPDALAQAISAPVQLQRNAVFPVENFGSAMAPLYTTLALWIGALLVMVTLKITPSERTIRELDRPTSRQLFLGRFCTVAVLSLLQSSCVCLGNMLFLGVQVVNPVLYLLCFWISGLVFSFIIYTLVALFANFGKALSVILLIVQVAGGGGSFPLPLLPSFFQEMSPYLPIAHAVNAMRAAMFGVYANDFWIQIGQLALFIIPFALLGLVLNKPLGMIVPRFVKRVESSKLM